MPMPQCRFQQGPATRERVGRVRDFADTIVSWYWGSRRWLAELALALRQEELPAGANQTSVYTRRPTAKFRPAGAISRPCGIGSA